ncbi:MAG: IclR family transcriptional regulator [Terriglobia bacterium]
MRAPRNSKAAAVGVLTKVLRIFDALQRDPAGLRLKQICDLTGLNKSTAYRFLSHLEREGYLVREEHGVYMLGMRLFELASASNHESTLRRVAAPVLRDLQRATGETVNLGILQGPSMVYLEVIESAHEFRMAARIGAQNPVHATALGKALTAFLSPEKAERLLESMQFESLTPNTISSLERMGEELERVRAQGFAVDNEERLLGCRCIGAPILNSLGQAVAAISVSGPTTRVSASQIAAFGQALREAAQAISTRIGFSVSPSSPARPELTADGGFPLPQA